MLMIFMLMDRFLTVVLFPMYREGDRVTDMGKKVVCAISWILPFLVGLACTVAKSRKQLTFGELMSAIYIIRYDIQGVSII